MSVSLSASRASSHSSTGNSQLKQESFADLFEKSFSNDNFRKGAIIKAMVVGMRDDKVIVNAGLKSDAVISLSEFKGDEIKLGDEVEVVIEMLVNYYGETCLSRERAKWVKVWNELVEKHKSGETVMGTITERVKGGFTVDLGHVLAFLPGSLVDIKPVRDTSYLEGKEHEFKVIKMDDKRNNVVVSRRAILEQESSEERLSRLEELQEGQEIKGVVKNITDYGAFIDLGGIDGLLHITDLSWKRIKHPSELLTVGDDIQVKILKFDREKNRVSLGLKQLGTDPWASIEQRYPVSSRISGVITNITDYGCFVEIEEGVEGLVHMSEMDWTNKNVHPSKVVKLGDAVDVIVLDIDESRRRVSLGIKQCKKNPWAEFAEKYKEGDKISGEICSITDFGVFLGLEGEIDGLVHLTDLSWTLSGNEAVKKYKKGDQLESVVLSIDSERERISLGVKQLESDPVNEYIQAHKGTVVSGTITDIQENEVLVSLSDKVSAVIALSDYKGSSDALKIGEKLEANCSGFSQKGHMVQLGSTEASKVKEKSEPKPKRVIPAKTTLGDLLKEHIQDEEKDD